MSVGPSVVLVFLSDGRGSTSFVLTAMEGPDFRSFMTAFLRYADHGLGKVYNYAWSLGMSVGPAPALVFLWEDRGSTSFVLTAIGVGVVLVGVYVVSNVWKEPEYKVILGWNPDALPADWREGRRRYFAINWIQLAATWTAMALFPI